LCNGSRRITGTNGKTTTNITTNLAGIYNFENVMAALCVALQFRVEIEKAIDAISQYQPSMNRSQVHRSQKNLLILDAYNANPSSMRVAIDNFQRLAAENKVIILGDMFELGEESAAEHREILHIINELKDVKVYTAGPYFYEAAQEFRNIKRYQSTDELKFALAENSLSNATILVKGSRGMKLETVVEIL
jgi:UDP-N-acetylmuramoyl-tripeptide--D-alanyl-D-alanine ligase